GATRGSARGEREGLVPGLFLRRRPARARAGRRLACARRCRRWLLAAREGPRRRAASRRPRRRRARPHGPTRRRGGIPRRRQAQGGAWAAPVRADRAGRILAGGLGILR